MENIILRILDDDYNRIDNIRFMSDGDISFLKEYKHFVYNVDFYKGTNKVSTRKIDVFITHINNSKIQISCSGFDEKIYDKAIITSLSAYSNSDELLIRFEHEITYTFGK